MRMKSKHFSLWSAAQGPSSPLPTHPQLAVLGRAEEKLGEEPKAMAMREANDTEYNDEYPTCVKTYSTLRIFSDVLDPESITKQLGIEPTSSFRKGDVHCQGKLQRKANGWFFCTDTLSRSRDTRRHLDLILAELDGKDVALNALQARGCKVDVTNYWVSIGHGGPWLMPPQSLRLGTLGISIWWDVYFGDDSEGG